MSLITIPGASTVESWTRSPVAGNNLADKPVCADVGHNVVRAEQFSYDLKMLKRATLVGETTRGGAHAGSSTESTITSG